MDSAQIDKGGGGGDDLPPLDGLVLALVKKLPPAGTAEWKTRDRVMWLKMAAMAFDMAYGQGDPIEIKEIDLQLSLSPTKIHDMKSEQAHRVLGDDQLALSGIQDTRHVSLGHRAPNQDSTEERRLRKYKRADPFYLSPQWRALRPFILRRDGHRCVICKCDVSGKGEARVDHIKPRKTHLHLALDPANLRVLCCTCDAQSHRERARGGGGDRQERFIIRRGVTVDGWPI